MSDNQKLISKLTKAEILAGFSNEDRFVTMNYGAAHCIEEISNFLKANLINSNIGIVLDSRDRSVSELIVYSSEVNQDIKVKKLFSSLLESKEFNNLIKHHLLNNYNYNYEYFVIELKRTIAFQYKQIESFNEVEELRKELDISSSNNKKLKI